MFLPEPAPSQLSKTPHQAHILLVDDERLLSEGLRLALQEVGYEVTAAACGREAKERILSCPIDLVLLDIGLPDVDGFTLCAELRKLRDVPVIILSGLSNVHDVLDGYHSGATDFISKPFQLRILVQHIETALYTTATASTATDVGPTVSPVTFQRKHDLPSWQSHDRTDLQRCQSAGDVTYTGASQRTTQSVLIPTTMVSIRF
jgi:DNA-binding response OmpR family regulator